ncbi:AAA family ATPase [Chitinimonas sp.]|uniref:AAA family ATPase n=1 Tax=Chitinimonas sp. TaxID=1934313 RepID=UPI0035B38A63
MNRVIYQHGLVIGKFYPPHRGHEYLIRTAARHAACVTVAVLGSSVESLPMPLRVQWLRETVQDLPNVRIVAELDDVAVDYHNPAIWDAHIAIMRQALAQADRQYGAARPVDAVFTSEPYGDELARRFAASHICLDQPRVLHPVSGTAVRGSPIARWLHLPEPVRAGLALRVVVVGAESTGTTTLSRDLAQALQARGGIWSRTEWVGEFGREYSANLLAVARASNPHCRPEQLDWHSEDFVAIALEQCRREQQAARSGGPVLVCDTDALATHIWHERYMAQANAAVARIAAAMPPRALYLLTSHAGVPFEDDGLRDGEHLRPWMTARFREVLAAQTVPWLELEGDRPARCHKALAAIDSLLAQAWQFALPLEARQQGN